MEELESLINRWCLGEKFYDVQVDYAALRKQHLLCARNGYELLALLLLCSFARLVLLRSMSCRNLANKTNTKTCYHDRVTDTSTPKKNWTFQREFLLVRKSLWRCEIARVSASRNHLTGIHRTQVYDRIPKQPSTVTMNAIIFIPSRIKRLYLSWE